MPLLLILLAALLLPASPALALVPVVVLGYIAPIHDDGRGAGDCSVIGGFVYRGSAIPGLIGRYVFGDFCTGNIWALEETAPDVFAAEPLQNTGFGLTSFGQDAAGELYVTVNDDVLRLAPVPSIPGLPLVAYPVLLLAALLPRTAPPAGALKNRSAGGNRPRRNGQGLRRLASLVASPRTVRELRQ